MPARRHDRTVAVLATGGTIASRPSGDAGVIATAGGEELLAAVPGLDRVARVRVEEPFRVNSYDIGIDEMLALARRVRALADEGVDGIVVTHGTDTMEESAYLVDLLHDGDVPVVFTGAQRNAAEPDTDGPRNVLDAVRVATHPDARGIGAVIAMGGRIDAARDATKMHTRALRAFGSPGHGPLGEVWGGEVRISRRRVRATNLAGTHALERRVPLVKLTAGTDARFVRVAREAGDAGLVLEAFGLGNANREVAAEVGRAVAGGMTVVVVSRCPQGAVAPVYGAGGGADLAAAGAVFGGDLSGQKARVLLMVALAAAAGRRVPVETLLAPHFAP